MFTVGNPLECDGSDDACKSKAAPNCFQGLRRIDNLQGKKLEVKKEVRKGVRKKVKKGVREGICCLLLKVRNE